MSGRLNAILTPEDLKKGELVKVGWHPVEFTDYVESEASAEAKNPGSLNITLHFRVIDGPDKGATLKRLFNETALGFGKNLWKTWAFPADSNGNFRITADAIQAKIGSKLKVYVKRSKSNKGNEYNDVQDFMPLTAAERAPEE